MITVATGADVIARNDFALLAGKTVGFVGNHTSRLRDGTPTHLALQRSGRATLSKLFSPEHGAFGREDQEDVADDVDPATRLPIHSLYGATRKPTPEMLSGIDALVFELQDVGARFYTYASTMLLCLEACAEAGIPLIVLDRPNPLGGHRLCEGPLPDMGRRSFVCSSGIPVKHGLTLAEIAMIGKRERGLPDDCLILARCEGYRPSQWWDETGLPWTAPSPAMGSVATATVYPGVCLLEQTNVSVGRGTEAPFEIAGAPWIDAEPWAEHINDDTGSGIVAEPYWFTPSHSKFEGKPCRGIRLSVTDRDALLSVKLGIAMVTGLHKLHPGEFEIDGVDTLLASGDTLQQVKAGVSTEGICEPWQAQVAGWRDSVVDCLLY